MRSSPASAAGFAWVGVLVLSAVVEAVPLRVVDGTWLAVGVETVDDAVVIDVELLDRAGEPLPGRTVVVQTLASHGGTFFRALQTDIDGRARAASRLAPGTWSAHARWGGDVRRDEASSVRTFTLPDPDASIAWEVPAWSVGLDVPAVARCASPACAGATARAVCGDRPMDEAEARPLDAHGTAQFALSVDDESAADVVCRVRVEIPDDESSVMLEREATVRPLHEIHLRGEAEVVRGLPFRPPSVALTAHASDRRGPLAGMTLRWIADGRTVARTPVDPFGRSTIHLADVDREGVSVTVELLLPDGGDGDEVRVGAYEWDVAPGNDPRETAIRAFAWLTIAMALVWAVVAFGRRWRGFRRQHPEPSGPSTGDDGVSRASTTRGRDAGRGWWRAVDARRGTAVGGRVEVSPERVVAFGPAGMPLDELSAVDAARVVAPGYVSAAWKRAAGTEDVQVVRLVAVRDACRAELERVLVARGEGRVPSNWWGRWTTDELAAAVAPSLRRLTIRREPDPVALREFETRIDRVRRGEGAEPDAFLALCQLVDLVSFGRLPARVGDPVVLAGWLADRSLGLEASEAPTEAS